MSQDKKKSPLEKLVEIQQNQTLPVKVVPKNRLDEDSPRVVTPVVEEPVTPVFPLLNPAELLQGGKNLAISNSSLVVNLSLNVDGAAVDKAFEKSAEVAKKIAAAGAAMLGTALILGNGQTGKEASKSRIKRPKVALKPKVKVPKFNKD